MQTFSLYLWYGISIHMHIKVMCLRCYIKFKDVLRERILKIRNVVSQTLFSLLFICCLPPPCYQRSVQMLIGSDLPPLTCLMDVCAFVRMCVICIYEYVYAIDTNIF